MTTFKQESRYRSILKGISWRIIGSVDTILIVLFITCSMGSCSIEHAITIGFFEFFIKFLFYYGHERAWQRIFFGKEISKKRLLLKTIWWRSVATMTTFVISGMVLNAFDEKALYIALIELISKFMLYYLHERIWLKLSFGIVQH